jgi:hypothetical protein
MYHNDMLGWWSKRTRLRTLSPAHAMLPRHSRLVPWAAWPWCTGAEQRTAVEVVGEERRERHGAVEEEDRKPRRTGDDGWEAPTSQKRTAGTRDLLPTSRGSLCQLAALLSETRVPPAALPPLPAALLSEPECLWLYGVSIWYVYIWASGYVAESDQSQ